MARRTPTQMAQDALDTAQRKVKRADARLDRSIIERDAALLALSQAEVERDYAAAHPLLKAAEADKAEDVTA